MMISPSVSLIDRLARSATLWCGVLLFGVSSSLGQEAPPDKATASTTDPDGQLPINRLSEEVLGHLRDRDPEAAFDTMATLTDQISTIANIAYTPLPSAAGGLYRSVMQQSAAEQYDLLQQWTMPQPERESIRLLTSPVPTSAPPKVFARSLRERPRDSTFAVASVGPVRGLFCSGWLFVRAADEMGRLPRLRIELEELDQRKVNGARELLMLAHLAGNRGNLDWVRQNLQERADADSEQELRLEDLHGVAIAAAATLHRETQAAGEAYLETLVERGRLGQGIAMRPHLRIAHAMAVQAHRGLSPPQTLYENRLKDWIPVTVSSAKQIERGGCEGLWMTHEQHVLHLAGGEPDLLLLRFPVIGTFDFICETQEGGSIGTDGGLTYGGRQYQALGRTDELTVWDADGQHAVKRPSPFARAANHPVFNRISIRSTDDGYQFESNFHPVWFDDDAATASPWLGLRSSGTKRPVFRNVHLTGDPVIPREVDLLGSDQLRGWQSSFFAESQPGVDRSQIDRAQNDAEGKSSEKETTDASAESLDWRIRSGELVGAAHQDREAADRPGLLQYQRPLLPGDSVSYQFFAESDDVGVHPALGRLAFLLEPSGVRVRWITTGKTEWTGLPADNAALEPLNRRGPRPLPIKPNEWNTVVIAMTESTVRITLNDEVIYQRPREDGGAEQLGLYRPVRQSEVRVRDAVMTGDWPKTLPADLLQTTTD